MAGVIGTTKFAYDLWGESINLASRLESNGEPGRIQTSQAFRQKAPPHLHFEERGDITLKGVGQVRTHWLIASNDSATENLKELPGSSLCETTLHATPKKTATTHLVSTLTKWP